MLRALKCHLLSLAYRHVQLALCGEGTGLSTCFFSSKSSACEGMKEENISREFPGDEMGLSSNQMLCGCCRVHLFLVSLVLRTGEKGNASPAGMDNSHIYFTDYPMTPLSVHYVEIQGCRGVPNFLCFANSASVTCRCCYRKDKKFFLYLNKCFPNMV